VRSLAHLSDLHFGRTDHRVLDALRRRLWQLKPDLVVVSGDLTQRARVRQFREARAFLDTLPKPQLVVPGNHDVPLYNVLARFLAPLSGYRRFVADELDPSFVDDEIAVVGINTARSFTWKGGGVSEAQLARAEEKLCRLKAGVVKIVVTHHPLPQLGRLARCGVDVQVSGHLHATSIGATSPLLVQAGTATSSRTRAEPNSFNVLRIGGQRIEIEHYALRGGDFQRSESRAFQRQARGWRSVTIFG
jgi:predicted MPP superfamily phosphohydrolase